ncbi:hypothetical protein [Sodalis sp. RH20]|uniref:hypothetical protein n=1 Tax=unclassified Sodalis (in: enterobacteria) TaxID=2636512 RepID=UPI0039B3BF1C
MKKNEKQLIAFLKAKKFKNKSNGNVIEISGRTKDVFSYLNDMYYKNYFTPTTVSAPRMALAVGYEPDRMLWSLTELIAVQWLIGAFRTIPDQEDWFHYNYIIGFNELERDYEYL